MATEATQYTDSARYDLSETRQAIEEVSRALALIGQKAAADPEYRKELRKNQIGLMRAAGLSLISLARVAQEGSVSEEELHVYGMGLLAINDDDVDEFRLSQICIGTCRKQTLWLCGGCTNSFRVATS